MRSKWRFSLLLPIAALMQAHAQSPVEVQHQTTTGGTSVTLPNPAKPGNLLIAGVDFFSGYPLATPAGWTLIGAETNGNWGATFYTHVSVAGESSTYDFPSTGNSVDMYEIAGYNAAAPINLLTGALGSGGSGAMTTVTTGPGTPTVSSTLALAWFSPDVQVSVTGAGAGWTFDGCDYRRYNTLCSATRQALTSDTTTPIQTTFTIAGTFSGNYTMLILVAPGTAGVIPLAAPVPSVAAGTYASTQTVALSQAAGAPIHYTMDNSTPTCASPLYSSPLVLDATYTINALSCDAKGNTSVGFTGYYLIAPGTLKGMALGTMANLNGFVPFASPTAPDQWQTNIASAAVDANSATTIAFLKSSGMTGTNADVTMTFNVVDSRDPGTPLTNVYSLRDPSFINQSDVAYAPVGPFTPIEDNPTPICVINNQGSIGGYDNHVLTLDRWTGFLWEMWHAVTGCVGIRQVEDGQSDKPADPTQTAYMAATDIAIFDLLQPSAFQRPINYTSADAGGMSIFQGLGRKDEFMAGDVKHALRFTFPTAGSLSVTGSSYGYFASPAKHSAPLGTQPPDANNLIFDGMRLRLKAGYTNSLCSSTISQEMVKELSNFGIILADQGKAGQVQFTPDAWNSADLACFNSIPIDSFDLVQRQPIRYGVFSNYPLDPNSVAMDPNVVVATPIAGKPVPVLSSAKATPSTIAAGSCSTLSASFSGASYAYWDKAGPVRPGDTQTVCPTVTTTYRLIVQGESLIDDDGSGDGGNNATAVNGRAYEDVLVVVAASGQRAAPQGMRRWQGIRRP